MTLADMLVVMNGGQVEQIGTPLDDLREAGDDLRRLLHRLAADEPDADCAPTRSSRSSPATAAPREAGILGIRPEDFVITDQTAGRRHRTAAHRGGDRARRRRNFRLRHARPGGAARRRHPRRAAARRGHRPHSRHRGPAIGESIRRRRGAKSCICSAATGGRGSS